MTAEFKDVVHGSLLRVLPTASECLVPGEVLVVRDHYAGLGLHVHCDRGCHFLAPTSEGLLKDFEDASET